MFEIIFGGFWLFVTGCITISFLGTMIAVSFTENLFDNVFVILFLLLFWSIGLFILRIGLKRLIKDKKTDKYGLETYAMILRTFFSGKSINENPVYNAEFAVYDPATHEVYKTIEEIGYSTDEYVPGTFVFGKFFNGDINIERVGPSVVVPEYIRTQMGDYVEHYKIQLPDEQIMVDGVEYIRKDVIHKYLQQ